MAAGTESLSPGKAPDPVSQGKVDPVNRLLVCEDTGDYESLRCAREFADFTFHVGWRYIERERAKG